MRPIGSAIAALLIFALTACAGATDPQADPSAGYQDGEWGPDSGAGEPLYGSWSGSHFPILSSEDREAIGRITYAEAGNQGEDGIAAVIFTILNRVNSGQFGESVQEVIDAPNQFEPATRAGGWRYLRPLDPSQGDEFETILNAILAGELADLTRGALFFQNARIVAARAARGAVSSYLVDFGGTPPVAEIGDHRFYDWRAAINLAARRHQTEDAATVDPADIGYADGTDEILAPQPGSEEISPESELSFGPAWDEPQVGLSAAADGLAAEPLDGEQCAAGDYC